MPSDLIGFSEINEKKIGRLFVNIFDSRFGNFRVGVTKSMLIYRESVVEMVRSYEVTQFLPGVKECALFSNLSNLSNIPSTGLTLGVQVFVIAP